MKKDRTLVIAVEDITTAGVVAAGAAHLAMEQGVSRLVLLHVLDEHVIANSLTALIAGPPGVVESAEEGWALLRVAEEVIAAQCRAAHHGVPAMICELGEGRVGPTIAQVAADADAASIVVGARHHHALGSFIHPDVVEYLRHHTAIPVHVIALHTEDAASTTPQPAGSPVS